MNLGYQVNNYIHKVYSYYYYLKLIESWKVNNYRLTTAVSNSPDT